MTATAARESALESVPEARPGGGFLVAPVPRGGIFSREKLSEDQRLFVATARAFWENEVLSRVDEIEHKKTVDENGREVPIAIALLRKAGALGLLAIDIPERYGGLGLDKTTTMAVAEALAGESSEGATFGAHSGIGTLPIVFFGTEEQKARWLPKLATAEVVSCYALTEPGHGSDALGGKATAMRAADGAHYVLNGEKVFITNGGWADLAIVFARLDGGPYSAFLVDLHSPGVTRGPEERKMGIRGSSTTSLTFQDVRVPKENLLGGPGDAARIALNILYIGRLKLGFGDLGNAKYAFDRTVAFGKERKQFGQPIITFDLQKAKLAEMAQWIYAADSVLYRTIGRIDDEIARAPAGRDPEEWVIEVTRRFGVEASIGKVLGSETCAKVAYHAVRMHGGYGFMEEYQVERIARDNVVSTIYEGTNDVNRLVIGGDLVKNIFGARIPFREYLDDVKERLRAARLRDPLLAGPLAEEHERTAALKRATAWLVERALIGIGKDVRVLQQPMVALADALIALYAADSTVARAYDRLRAGAGEDAAAIEAIAKLVVGEACREVEAKALEIIPAVTPRERVKEQLGTFRRLAAAFAGAVDVEGLKRVVADRAIEAGKYAF